MKKILVLSLALLMIFSCAKKDNPFEHKIVIQLNHEKAPVTVDNFLAYCKEGHYEGTIFHRVISDFMIQGGGFTADMTKKPTKDPIKNEAGNGLSNLRGTIAMARTADPHSASAQFFINTVNNERLDYKNESVAGWGYCVFGKVTDGMDVVDQIRRTPVKNLPNGMQNVPEKPITIKAVKVDGYTVTFGIDLPESLNMPQ